MYGMKPKLNSDPGKLMTETFHDLAKAYGHHESLITPHLDRKCPS